LNKYIKWTFRG